MSHDPEVAADELRYAEAMVRERALAADKVGLALRGLLAEYDRRGAIELRAKDVLSFSSGGEQDAARFILTSEWKPPADR